MRMQLKEMCDSLDQILADMEPISIRMRMIDFLCTANNYPTRSSEPLENVHQLAHELIYNPAPYVGAMEEVGEIRYRKNNVPSTVADKCIEFEGFGRPAYKQHAYLDRSVAQHYEIRHNLKLKYPFLHTVAFRENEHTTIFIPIELLDVIIYA
jgi:hypothetical protein